MVSTVHGHHVLFPFTYGINLIPLQSTSGMAPSSQDHYDIRMVCQQQHPQ